MALGAPYAAFSTFGRMAWFDDEGTVMAWLHSFRAGYAAYDGFYAMYGPLYFDIYGVLFRALHLPLVHWVNRLVAASMWLAYSAGFAAICFRLTRSPAATALAFVLVLVWLSELMNSPGHPEELCLALLAGCLLATASTTGSRRMAAMATVGALVASLALVKINIGAYAGMATGVVLLRGSARAPWVRIALPLATGAILMMPLAVESLLLGLGWVQTYALFATLVMVAGVAGTLRPPGLAPLLATRDWLALVLGGVVGTAAIVTVLVLAGSTPQGIFHAVILQNARFVRNWFIPLQLGLVGLAAAGLSVALAVAYALLTRRPTGAMQAHLPLLVLVLKAGYLLVFAGLWFSPRAVFALLVPFSWLVAAAPFAGQEHGRLRASLGLMGAALALYPFPVAGGQLRIADLVPVLIVPVLAMDVVAGLEQAGSAATVANRALRMALVALAVGLGAIATARSAATYARNVPLNLPGTRYIRVPRSQAETMQWVVTQLSGCASSYSLPGLYSFLLWTGQGFPSQMNVNASLNVFDDVQQATIVQALARQPDLCIVYMPSLLRFLDRGQIKTDPPLLHYLLTQFIPTAERDGYVIMRRREP